MRGIRTGFLVVTVISVIAFIAWALSVSRTSTPLILHAETTEACSQIPSDEPSETVAGALVFGRLLASTALDVTGRLLEAAAKAREVSASATTGGALYRLNEKGNGWIAHSASCLAYWVTGEEESTPIDSFIHLGSSETNKALAARWKVLSLKWVPALYGEVRLVPRAGGKAMSLQPMLFFGRPLPQVSGLFRTSSVIAVSVKITRLGETAPLGTLQLSVPASLRKSTVYELVELRGKSGPWFSAPVPGAAEGVALETVDALFNADIAMTVTAPGSGLAAVLSAVLNNEKANISEYALGSLKSEGQLPSK
jgi:hypothetical protein